MFLNSNIPLYVLHDSRVPPGSTDYTTLVVLHGLAYHVAIFAKLLNLGQSYNTRVLLVNRRDYPGSVPYTPAESALLPAGPLDDTADDGEIEESMKDIRAFMEGRAKELYEFLEGLVKEGVVPPADRKNNKGGIVVAGWSLGTGWMTALLAHAPSFPVGDVNLADYMQRVVFFDPPFQVMGYPTTEKGLYNPLFEKDIPPEERESVFAKWVSGYFEHGDTPETLALKTPLREPTPTLTRLTPADIARTLYLPAAGAEAPDSALLYRGIELGSWVSLREAALAERAGNGWDAVEVRNVTCERSPCDCLWAMMCLRREVDEARAKGLPVRDVHFVLIKGANHFVQWDQPEHLLRALVGNEDIVQ